MPEGITSAYALATNKIRAELSTAAILTGPNSALVPGNWDISRASDNKKWTVADVEQYGTTATIFDLTVYPDWDDSSKYNVESAGAPAAGLRAADGTTTYSDPRSADFYGAVEIQRQTRNIRAKAGVDFRLPTVAVRGGEVARTYQVTSAGNYELWQGANARESDYFRRLMTPVGSFSWLPGYGIGFVPKTLVGAAAMLNARREIVDQIKSEPGVESVAPRITRPSGSVVYVSVAVQHETAGQIEAGHNIQG